jgi:hypothetical protein
MFKSIEEVKVANSKIGDHWFTPGTMDYFNSIIETDILYGKYFITSERYHYSNEKKYTVREVSPDGSIDTVGEFMQYDLFNDALERVDDLVGEKP